MGPTGKVGKSWWRGPGESGAPGVMTSGHDFTALLNGISMETLHTVPCGRPKIDNRSRNLLKEYIFSSHISGLETGTLFS